MHNPIELLMQKYANNKIVALTFPHKEIWEIALCKLGIDLYRINLGGSSWDENYKRPENHYIMPENTIEPQINYSVLIIPHHQYPEQLVSQIHQAVNLPTIQVNDVNMKELPEAGWIENIDPSTVEFGQEWDKKFKQIRGML